MSATYKHPDFHNKPFQEGVIFGGQAMPDASEASLEHLCPYDKNLDAESDYSMWMQGFDFAANGDWSMHGVVHIRSYGGEQ